MPQPSLSPFTLAELTPREQIRLTNVDNELAFHRLMIHKLALHRKSILDRARQRSYDKRSSKHTHPVSTNP